MTFDIRLKKPTQKNNKIVENFFIKKKLNLI